MLHTDISMLHSQQPRSCKELQSVQSWTGRTESPCISSGKDHRSLFLSLLLLQGPPFPVKSNMEVLSTLLIPYSLKPVPEFLLNISVAFNFHEAWLFNLEQI